jgi:hypothetical protein
MKRLETCGLEATLVNGDRAVFRVCIWLMESVSLRPWHHHPTFPATRRSPSDTGRSRLEVGKTAEWHFHSQHVRCPFFPQRRTYQVSVSHPIQSSSSAGISCVAHHSTFFNCFRSTIHRVAAPPPDQQHVDRLGLLYFARPHNDLHLGTTRIVPSFSALDSLKMSLKRSVKSRLWKVSAAYCRRILDLNLISSLWEHTLFRVDIF